MEIWKPIKNYENLYEVSNKGRVKSLPKKNNGYKTHILNGVHQRRSHTIYLQVPLSKNGVVKRYSIHRLVAEAFIPNPLNKPYVNHIDSNGLNNNMENLEWCTQLENIHHGMKYGNIDSKQMMKKANKFSANAHRQRTENKLKQILGNNLISVERSEISTRPNCFRTFANIKCNNCSKHFKRRVDYIKSISNNPTLCTKCNRGINNG